MLLLCIFSSLHFDANLSPYGQSLSVDYISVDLPNCGAFPEIESAVNFATVRLTCNVYLFTHACKNVFAISVGLTLTEQSGLEGPVISWILALGFHS